MLQTESIVPENLLTSEHSNVEHAELFPVQGQEALRAVESRQSDIVNVGSAVVEITQEESTTETAPSPEVDPEKIAALVLGIGVYMQYLRRNAVMTGKK